MRQKNYFVVSAHREENIDLDNNFEILADSINAVAEEYKMPIVFSTHPRTYKKIELKQIKFHPLVSILPPFGFFDYVNLQINAFCVLSDSGTISEEASMMKFPAISIRTSTERPEAVDVGSIIIGGIKRDEILNSIRVCMLTTSIKKLPIEYEIEDVSRRVIRVIQSYTSIVNKTIWNKNEK